MLICSEYDKWVQNALTNLQRRSARWEVWERIVDWARQLVQTCVCLPVALKFPEFYKYRFPVRHFFDLFA